MALNSCTAALHLALEALGVGPGDEVIVPTWTFAASAEVVAYLGARPVLVDVDARTLNATPETILAAVTARTKAVVVGAFRGPAGRDRDDHALLDARGIPGCGGRRPRVSRAGSAARTADTSGDVVDNLTGLVIGLVAAAAYLHLRRGRSRA